MLCMAASQVTEEDLAAYAQDPRLDAAMYESQASPWRLRMTSDSLWHDQKPRRPERLWSELTLLW